MIFGVAFTIVQTLSLLSAGRPVPVASILDASLQLGLLGITGIALIVGPVTALVQNLAKRRLSVTAAALLGALLGPALLIALWLLIRELDETFGGLLHFWVRRPAEFIVGTIPHAAASAFFAAWLVADRQRQRSVPDEPLQPSRGGGPSMLDA